MYALEIREEIESAIEFYGKEMPSNVRKAISRCNSSLFNGPLYFDSEGNECSCFDNGAKQHDWRGDIRLIADWADQIPDCSVEISYNAETEESEFQEIEGSRKQILGSLIGKELSNYL